MSDHNFISETKITLKILKFGLQIVLNTAPHTDKMFIFLGTDLAFKKSTEVKLWLKGPGIFFQFQKMFALRAGQKKGRAKRPGIQGITIFRKK